MRRGENKREKMREREKEEGGRGRQAVYKVERGE